MRTRLVLVMVEEKGLIVDTREKTARGILTSQDWTWPAEETGLWEERGERMREEEKKEGRADRGPRGLRKHMGIKRMLVKMAELYRIRSWRMGSGAQTLGWRGLEERERGSGEQCWEEPQKLRLIFWDLTSHIMSKWTGPLSWALQFFLFVLPSGHLSLKGFFFFSLGDSGSL